MTKFLDASVFTLGKVTISGVESANMQTPEKKSFWDYACVITSKDQNLTKAHVLFLEAKIIERALSADRVTLDNNKTNPYESIPESDISDMSYFFDQTSVVLPALGIEMFSPRELERAVIGERDMRPSSEPIFEPAKPFDTS